MKRRAALIPALLVLTLAALSAQNLTRRIPSRSSRASIEALQRVNADTLRGAVLDSVLVAGFDKPLRVGRESMFVTNGTADTIAGMGIEVEYLDMSGRQLHRAAHPVRCLIPPAQTRRVEIPSFDRAGAFYYRLSAVPRRATQATPFDVRVTVTYIIPKQ